MANKDKRKGHDKTTKTSAKAYAMMADAAKKAADKEVQRFNEAVKATLAK